MSDFAAGGGTAIIESEVASKSVNTNTGSETVSWDPTKEVLVQFIAGCQSDTVPSLQINGYTTDYNWRFQDGSAANDQPHFGLGDDFTTWFEGTFRLRHIENGAHIGAFLDYHAGNGSSARREEARVGTLAKDEDVSQITILSTSTGEITSLDVTVWEVQR